MHLAEIDYISNTQTSIFHQAKAASKVIFAVLMLTAIISTADVIILSLILAVILTIFVLAKIPIIKIGHLALYPAFFSTIFALIYSQGVWEVGLLIVLKALCAALVMIFLIATTPYVDLFSFLALIMPRLLVDIFFFTYRAVFVLISKSENIFRTIRLRGGYRHISWLINIRCAAGMVGILMLEAIAMGERMHKIYCLRGYSEFVSGPVDVWPLCYKDVLMLTLGAAVLTGVVLL